MTYKLAGYFLLATQLLLKIDRKKHWITQEKIILL